MAQSQQGGNRPIAVGDMKIRDLGGNSVGVTLDRNALEEMEIVDEDGDLTGEYWARQIIYENGDVELSLKDE